MKQLSRNNMNRAMRAAQFQKSLGHAIKLFRQFEEELKNDPWRFIPKGKDPDGFEVEAYLLVDRMPPTKEGVSVYAPVGVAFSVFNEDAEEEDVYAFRLCDGRDTESFFCGFNESLPHYILGRIYNGERDSDGRLIEYHELID